MEKNLLFNSFRVLPLLLVFTLSICVNKGYAGSGLLSHLREEDPIADFPWHEGFGDDSPTRPLWSQFQEEGDKFWTFDVGSSGGSISEPHSGELNARFSSSWDGGVTKLITPVLDISELESPRIVFWYGQQAWSGDQNELRVYYRAEETSPWVEIFHSDENISVWTRQTLALPEKSDTYQIAFEGTDNWGRANVLDDVVVEETPPFYTVDFSVYENSSGQAPVEGAVIEILGIADLLTNAQGEASIDLEDYDYTLRVSRSGYESEELDFTVEGEPKSIEVALNDQIIEPFNVEIIKEGFETGEALLRWNDAGDDHEFRYDNGMVNGVIGFEQGSLNSVFGSVHHYNGIIHEISWVLTHLAGPHYSVKIWVLGLTGNGTPDRNNVLYSAEEVPNTDNQWNTYTLEEPVHAPYGFFIGISYDGNIALATDNGKVEPWIFVPETQFAIMDITDQTEDFMDIGDINFERNYLLRAYGKNLGEVKHLSRERENKNFNSKPVYQALDNPFVPSGKPDWSPAAEERVFEHFNVYLNDMDTPFAGEVSGTEFLFSNLEEGEYQAGVQSVYTTGSSEIITVDFSIAGEEASYSVYFEVMDQENNFIEDAAITFLDETHQPGVYSFHEIMPGTYTYTVSAEGFDEESGEVTVTNEDVVEEVFLTPDDVSVSTVSEDEIRIYPNPARYAVSIASGKEMKRITVISMIGKKVQSFGVRDQFYNINVSGWRQGVYLLQILKTNGSVKTKRIRVLQ